MIGENLKSMLDEIKKQRIKVYSILTFPLSEARSDFELTITGTYFYVLSQTGIASIKFNEMFSDSIDIIKNRSIVVPFYRIYLTNTAQADLSMTVAIGVSSDVFSISDYSAPDVALMSGYLQQLRDSHAHAYGTQISKSNVVVNGTVIVHTVNAGKILILENFSFSFSTSAAAGNQASIIIRDASDVTQYILSSVYSYPINSSGFFGLACLISIPEGYDICLIGTTYVTVNGWIKGREI